MDDKTFDDPKIARDWISSVEQAGSGIRNSENDIYPRLNAWLKYGRPKDILEIGAGQGACSANIELAGRAYTGLEPSPILLARANQLYESENRRFVLGNAYDLPFPDGAFDAAFSVAVWHLLSDPNRAAKELSRVLRPNGHFFIVTANPHAYSAWQDIYTDVKMDGRRFEGKLQLIGNAESHDVLYFYPWDEIAETFQAVQLKIGETSTFRTSEKSNGRHYFIAIQGEKG